jgi:WD40 repeat protein
MFQKFVFQKSVSTLIQPVAAIMVAAIIVSSTAMVFSVSIAEVNRQMDTAAIGGLFDLIAVIFFTLINVVAAGKDSLVNGAKIGLYMGAAIGVAYFLLLLFLNNRLAPRLWRWGLAFVLAEAGAVGASLGASGLGTRYLLWFSIGGALFGLLVSLLLSKSPRKRFVETAHSDAAPLAVLITLIVGTGAVLLLILSPLIQPTRSAAAMMHSLTTAEVITPANAPTVSELAQIDATGVTQALFFPDGSKLALAMPEGVVLYDTATLTPIRTIQTGASRRIALSPNGDSLATIAGTTAQVWQVSDSTLLYTVTGHTGDVQDVAFSPDGHMLATASLDRSVRLWRASSGELLYTFNHLGHVYSLGFRFDGQVLATGSDMGITLWQPISGVRLRITDVIFATAHGVAFSPSGLHLAAAMSNGIVRLREGQNYLTSLDLPGQQEITALAFSPDGELLAFGGIDQSLHLWRLSDHLSLATLNGHQGAINSVAFSPDGRLLATTALDGTLRLWGTNVTGSTATPLASATPQAILAESSSMTGSVAITATTAPTITVSPAPALPTASPAPRVRVTIGVPSSLAATETLTPTLTSTLTPTLANTATPVPTSLPSPTATRTTAPTATLTPTPISVPASIPAQPGAILPALVGKLTVRSKMNLGSATDLAYSADGRRIAVAAAQHVLILDGQTLAEIGSIDTQATRVAFNPNGDSIVTVSGTTASLWRLADSALLNEFEVHSSAIMDVAFSPDGTLLATASLDQMARLWQVSDATLLRQFSHFGSVHSLAFSPNGETLATGTTVGTVLWRVSDGVRLRVLTLNPNRANSLTFSPDGQNLAAATENGNIWMWRDGGQGKWEVLQAHTNAASDVAFSPDGQLLASASADGTVRLWRTSDGAALSALSGNAGAVTGVTFQPDGTALLSLAADGTLYLWGLPLP